MPFDGTRLRDGRGTRCFNTTKPFSVESLVAWLEAQDPSVTYDYCEPEGCLAARYTEAMGGKIVGARYVIGAASCFMVLPEDLNEIAGASRRDGGNTHGAALARARRRVPARGK